MNKVLPLISLFIISIISIFYWTLKPKNELYDAKWNAPDTTLAITINGEISTTFPTTHGYVGIVECTTGSGKVEWNGAKWILTTSGITKGNTKCNVIFEVKRFEDIILANNEVKVPLTIPGKEASAHTLDDVESASSNVTSIFQKYYITYGTGWKANGANFDLTGTAVTSDTYANSYSSLVGKYLTGDSLSSAGSSTAGVMRTTTDLRKIYYVVSATSSSFVYKQIASNKNLTEALLASTEDDYGTSYYFRGAVKNNYLVFANKCWRIVRIVGDGSVKLVLHNDNVSGVPNPCSSSNNNATAAFARYSGSSYTSVFNSSDDNAYIGFMYGTVGASDYASAHANTNKSDILKNLETWYTNNLASYADKLADTIWCNDKSTRSDDLGYGTSTTYYGTYNRLVSTKQPSLKCPNDNNGGKLSKFTAVDTINGNGKLTYKIGLLTADEITYSGSIIGINNRAAYLQENTGTTVWWTMSPYFQSGRTGVANLGENSFGYMPTNYDYALRPAISLISSVDVTGSGTSEDPYVVK